MLILLSTILLLNLFNIFVPESLILLRVREYFILKFDYLH